MTNTKSSCPLSPKAEGDKGTATDCNVFHQLGQLPASASEPVTIFKATAGYSSGHKDRMTTCEAPQQRRSSRRMHPALSVCWCLMEPGQAPGKGKRRAAGEPVVQQHRAAVINPGGNHKINRTNRALCSFKNGSVPPITFYWIKLTASVLNGKGRATK